MHINDLTKAESYVINNKGTESPFTGNITKYKGKGLMSAKNAERLFIIHHDKFESDCGWPSFDDEIKGAVNRYPDPDGMRTEIICANCGAHLGHVFTGERLTAKNVTTLCQFSFSRFCSCTCSKLEDTEQQFLQEAVSGEWNIFFRKLRVLFQLLQVIPEDMLKILLIRKFVQEKQVMLKQLKYL